MANTKVTQEYVEVAVSGEAATRVTQEYVEAAAIGGATLTVTLAGTGTGVVTSDVSGISCPGACTAAFEFGTVVVLHADPDPGSTFTGWTGDGTGGGPDRTVLMSADKAVTATFTSTVPPVPVEPPRIVPSFLGCGSWTARINHKGGTPIVELPVSSFSCSRTLDDMSQASVTVNLSDVPDFCVEPLSRLQAWAYELELVRDQTSAWVGPVAGSLVYAADTVTIPARDLFQWFERRTLPSSSLQIDACDLFERYAQQADALDPINLSYDRKNSGTVIHRTVHGYDYVYAADAMRELAGVGVDFSFVGRTLRIRGAGQGDVAGILLDDHLLDDAQVTDDGLAVAGKIVVMGTTRTGSSVPVSATAGGIQPDIGLVTIVVTDQAITSQPDAQSAADTLLSVDAFPTRQLTATLKPDAPIGFDRLIPGDFVWITGRVGVCSIDEQMLLSQVAVAGPPETVTVTLSRLAHPKRRSFASHIADIDHQLRTITRKQLGQP